MMISQALLTLWLNSPYGIYRETCNTMQVLQNMHLMLEKALKTYWQQVSFRQSLLRRLLTLSKMSHLHHQRARFFDDPLSGISVDKMMDLKKIISLIHELTGLMTDLLQEIQQLQHILISMSFCKESEYSLLKADIAQYGVEVSEKIAELLEQHDIKCYHRYAKHAEYLDQRSFALIHDHLVLQIQCMRVFEEQLVSYQAKLMHTCRRAQVSTDRFVLSDKQAYCLEASVSHNTLC